MATVDATAPGVPVTRPPAAYFDPAGKGPDVCVLEDGYLCRSALGSNTSVSTSSQAQALVHRPGLPPKHGGRLYRYLRWNFGSVYRRIFTLAFVANVAVLVVLAVRALGPGPGGGLSYGGASAAVAANLLAALAVRNEHVVNAMFLVVVGSASTSARRRCMPLALRRLLAKVYSYGGVHSGCAVAATLWYIVFLVLLAHDDATASGALVADHRRLRRLAAVRTLTNVVSYGIIALLATILAFAHPRYRAVAHNWFECVHRFLGWSVVALFWAQVLLITADQTVATPGSHYGALLAANPTLWMLLCITALVVYPWTRLRLRAVEPEPLSDHCIKLNFRYRNAHYGQAIRLADAPLKETHAFATIPAASTKEKGVDAQGFSVIISNAGDWTRKIIRNPPTKLYTRGVPQYGVLRVAGLFEPVIVMATGSGIAPCLSLFVERPDHPVRIIWSAPRPLETFGQGVIDAVLAADPDAIIIDTKKEGRPDLVRIACDVWEASRAAAPPSARPSALPKARGPCEAVVIISNQKVTQKVVYGLESRGVAAYGALFDS